MDTGATRPTATSATAGVDAPDLRLFVFALFFVFGGITSLNDVIIPKLKELFTLNYTQAMLVQFCFFTAYLVIGIPGAQLVKKIGYMRGAAAGLLIAYSGPPFFLYGTMAALVFPDLFFPGGSAYSGNLASFAVQFVGFGARPVGAAIFGHYGDRVGRKATLVTTSSCPLRVRLSCPLAVSHSFNVLS